MGVRRYSRDPIKRAWQERFDDLQARSGVDYYSPTIGELLDHGIARAHWRCRSHGECFHTSEPFVLDRYGRRFKVRDLRWHYVCSVCGRNRPRLILLVD